jgi:alpha-glucoside transport system substrate-binding protein
LGLAACGTGDDNGDKGSEAQKSVKPGCEAFADYKGSGVVTVYTSIRDQEADDYVESFKQFEDCTGIDVQWEGSGEFEAQLNVKVAGGNAPDVAYIPQPGLLQRFAKQGKLIETKGKIADNVDNYYGEDWKNYATVDGKFYGAPNSANVKSLVWYSPSMFQKNGWEVPKTWDEMIALSDKIAATGIKPWCAGIESGDATGWPATDWMEDVMLRTAGPEDYDKWVNHDIPFNDPKVVNAANRVASILKNPKYVNGGFGDVRSIATTAFGDAGLPILTGKCGLHRQANFYSTFWGKGKTIAPNGDVFAFYFPPISGDAKPVLGGGEFVVAFRDAPEVESFREYVSSPEYVNHRAKIGPFTSANKELDVNNVIGDIGKLTVQILQDPQATFRFDGSDMMPAAVGTGTFWKGMTAWINGEDTKKVLDTIEASWPK